MTPDDDAFGVTIRTERLELVTDVELNHLMQLADLAVEGVHDPAVQPFNNAWTDGTPQEIRTRLAQHLGGYWEDWTAARWRCPFTVLLGGEPIGVQSISSTHFAHLGQVYTGSWLGLRHQGNGYGLEMRGAVLDFAFHGLGARTAHSSAHVDSYASRIITNKLGYEWNGSDPKLVRGELVWEHRYLLDRHRFKRPETVRGWSGLEESRAAFEEAK